MHIPLQRRNEIGSGQQAGHTDAGSPELALDSHRLQIHPQPLDRLLQIRIKDFARAYGSPRRTGRLRAEGRRKLGEECAHHPNAVLDLREVRVVAGLRNLSSGHDVNFVAKKGKGRSNAALEFALGGADAGDQLARIVRCEWT